MSWRDRLLPASFKGVPFEVESVDARTGRRIVVEDYPERDTPGYQDMGRRHQRLTLQAFIVGSDHDLRRNELLDACESEGPGELVHPWYGRLWGHVTDDSTWTSSAEDGGVTRLTLVFVQRAEIERNADGMERVVTAGAVSADGAAAAAAATAASATGDAEVARLKPALRRLYRTTKATEEAAIAAYLQVDAIGEDIEGEVYALCDTYATARAIAGWQWLPLAGRLQAAWGAWRRRWTAPALRRVCELSVEEVYDTAEASDARAADILAVFAPIEAEAAPHDVLLSLRSMRARTVGLLKETATTLPTLITIDVVEPVPAIVLAFERYGDIDREADVLKRNDVANPGFVAGRLTVPSA